MLEQTLLLIDAVINLALGAALTCFARPLIAALGLPPAAPRPFYASILGGVLFGIGIALLLQLRQAPGGRSGLGLTGAVAINGCGGLVLAWWLAFGALDVPAMGRIILWALAALLILLAGIELTARGAAHGR